MCIHDVCYILHLYKYIHIWQFQNHVYRRANGVEQVGLTSPTCPNSASFFAPACGSNLGHHLLRVNGSCLQAAVSPPLLLLQSLLGPRGLIASTRTVVHAHGALRVLARREEDVHRDPRVAAPECILRDQVDCFKVYPDNSYIIYI